VREVKGKEIIVSSGIAAGNMMTGDKIFVIIEGNKAVLEVKFPLKTITKRVLSGLSTAYQMKVSAGCRYSSN